ncbi:MAG: hypothetical protein LAP38_16435 [Acidobacteriia bacterium]|nr:hypothetical protein [Terriglobia bacterium]
MTKPRTIVVVGTMGTHPYAGMAWMHMQITGGLRRLGHNVYYMEVTSTWPYDPIRRRKVRDSNYTLSYVARVAAEFGLSDRWAYRRSYLDNEWFGLGRRRAKELLRDADAVFNVSGATLLRTREDLDVGNLIYLGTDPVICEIGFHNGDDIWKKVVEQHDLFATYGENIGKPQCSIPPLPLLKARTRQPVLLDLWEAGDPQRAEFTTVCNWRQDGLDLDFHGEIYRWSKHSEFLKVIDLPLLTSQPIELAMGLNPGDPGRGEAVRAIGMTTQERCLLDTNGWHLADAHAFTADVWPYRDYIKASRGEFTVAKDQNVRLRSGWFSERSACYLAAGRPVVTQDTGFGDVLPTGEGLFAFKTTEEAAAALEAINSDYPHHSRAARAIAEEYFRAETVLEKLMNDLGL